MYDAIGGRERVPWWNASWRLGRFFGVEVRVHVATVLVPLFAWFEFSRWAWLGAGEIAALVAIVTLGLYAVVWTHEMGHVLAARRWNVATSRITLSPLGGLAHLQEAAPSPKADIVISLAGPATHLAWLAVCWPLSIAWRPDSWLAAYAVESTVRLNLALLAFNLLPLFPMDGGRVLRGVIALRRDASRASYVAATVGAFGAVLLGVAGIFVSGVEGGLLIAIGITNFFACRAERRSARWGQGPYGETRSAWQEDPEAWKRGGEPAAAADSGGLLGRRRRAREEAEAERAGREREAAKEELDALLARVSQVRLAGLTPRERKRLEELSERMRRP